MKSHTDVGLEGLALSTALIYSIGLRSGLCASQSSSYTPNALIHVFMDLALCTGAQSCWNRKGLSPNCCYKVGSMDLSNISWDAVRVPFTETKGPSPAPQKQPHTIILPPPNFTLGTMQSDKYPSSGNHQTQTVSTALESSGGVLYTTASDALHCTCWCMAWMQDPSFYMAYHFVA